MVFRSIDSKLASVVNQLSAGQRGEVRSSSLVIHFFHEISEAGTFEGDVSCERLFRDRENCRDYYGRARGAASFNNICSIVTVVKEY